MSTAPAQAPPISVAVAVITGDATVVARTLKFLNAQVYVPTKIAVVGGDRGGRQAADTATTEWVPSLSSFLEGLDSSVSHVWLLEGGAMPRPDALVTLVEESERVDAGIAGSKLLSHTGDNELISVGIATDVFATPYRGLESGEVDHGQYDVVRDVAAVQGASMLVRRDLLKGLGGPDPIMSPQAAAIDLCHRARIRGGRIVVIPSSEVLVGAPPEPTWRDEAGTLRSMLKVYSAVTLAWAIPLRFIIGVVAGIASLFLGKLALVDFVRAWGWNIGHLPSTFTARRAARTNRAAGDIELFRYQARGSSAIRELGGSFGERLRERLVGEDRLSIAEIGRDLRQPAFVVGAVGVGFVLIATRKLWQGLPSVGYSLPLPPSAGETLGAYAGGWNPAGFGSVEPLHPFFALAGSVQWLTFGNPNLATGVLIAGSAIAGIWGMTRLLRTWSIEVVPGLLAGIILVAGPATRAIAQDTGVATLVAVGLLPWAIRVPLSLWPKDRWAQGGKVAATAWVIGLLALAAPPLLLVPVAALIGHALITPATKYGWRSAIVAGIGTVLAIPLLLTWLGAVDLGQFLGEGEAYWEPGWLLTIAIAVAVIGTVAAAPPRLSQIAGWGGVILAIGAVLSRSFDWGLGREVHLAGIAIVSLGSAIVAGAAFESLAQMDQTAAWRKASAGLALLGAGAVLVSSALVIVPGRAGLPADALADATRFIGASDESSVNSRVLVVGSQDDLPGESRSLDGTFYRVVSAPTPYLWEANLPEMGPADVALHETLQSLVAGETSRAGDALAPFGIRWVIFLGESPLDPVLAGQLDLVPLQGLRQTTFVSEAEFPVRALSDRELVWERDGLSYVGGGGGRVFLAETANSRWGTEWQQETWGNSVAASETIAFAPIDNRRSQARIALVLFGALVAVSWFGRRRR